MKKFMGGNDHRTSPSYFSGSHEYHYVAFHRTKKLLLRLAKWRIVEMFYIDDESTNAFVVAYRFTSDKFFDRFWPRTIKLASMLGRGGWAPFQDAYQYWTYFGCPCCGENPTHGFNDITPNVQGRTCPTQKARAAARKAA